MSDAQVEDVNYDDSRSCRLEARITFHPFTSSIHSCRTNEPSILLSRDGEGKPKGDNVLLLLKLEVGAGLNSYGPPFAPQTLHDDD